MAKGKGDPGSQAKAPVKSPARPGRTLKGGKTKAWKEGKPPEARTPKKKVRSAERVRKDEEIRAFRERRREQRLAQLAQEKADREAAEAELALQPTPVGVAVKVKRERKK